MIVGLLAGAVWAPGALGALGAATSVRVNPARGAIHRTFVLQFTIPDATGEIGGAYVADWLSVSRGGPSDPGCIGQADLRLHSARAGTAFRVALDPSRLGGRWCTGTFSGLLTQTVRLSCPAGPARAQSLCPEEIIAPIILGRFRFTVSHPPTGHQAGQSRADPDA
jgi:hypothetical protein